MNEKAWWEGKVDYNNPVPLRDAGIVWSPSDDNDVTVAGRAVVVDRRGPDNPDEPDPRDVFAYSSGAYLTDWREGTRTAQLHWSMEIILSLTEDGVAATDIKTVLESIAEVRSQRRRRQRRKKRLGK